MLKTYVVNPTLPNPIELDNSDRNNVTEMEEVRNKQAAGL